MPGTLAEMPETPSTQISQAVSVLLNKLPFSFLKQVDEWAGDAIRTRRLRRLVKILEEAHKIATERGLSTESMHVLADHVGLPWVDKASLRDEDDIRRAWASLFVTMATDSESDVHATYVNIMGGIDPLDCKVLDYVMSNGLVQTSDSQLVLAPLLDINIRNAMAVVGREPMRLQMSIENLVRQGCLDRFAKKPSDKSFYYGAAEVVMATTTGMHFYAAASGVDLISLAPVLSEEELKVRLGIHDLDQFQNNPSPPRLADPDTRVVR